MSKQRRTLNVTGRERWTLQNDTGRVSPVHDCDGVFRTSHSSIHTTQSKFPGNWFFFFLFFFLKNFGRHKSFLWGHWYPVLDFWWPNDLNEVFSHNSFYGQFTLLYHCFGSETTGVNRSQWIGDLVFISEEPDLKSKNWLEIMMRWWIEDFPREGGSSTSWSLHFLYIFCKIWWN